MPTAEIITIGTELLLGETSDTNTRFIAQTLRGLGLDIFRTQTVGDNSSRIAGVVSEALQRADIVITTGGLGPTVDDPTRLAIAEATGSELEFHPELWQQIVDRIARYGRTPTENQKRQAYIPKGAIVIPNPVGTAPAFILELPPSSDPALNTTPHVVITLPGVPREMETLLSDAVVPYLQERFSLNEVIQLRTLHVSGIGEGALDDQIGDLETLTNPTVGLTAHSGVVDIRIAAKAANLAEADRKIATVEQDLRTRLGARLFGADSDTIESVTLAVLAKRGWTLACYESGLDGLLLDRLAHADNAVYRGGSKLEFRQDSADGVADRLRKQFNASVILGLSLAVSGGRQTISMTLLSPLGWVEQQLDYGGHPKNAARWAVNTGLDWLRQEIKLDT